MVLCLMRSEFSACGSRQHAVSRPRLMNLTRFSRFAFSLFCKKSQKLNPLFSILCALFKKEYFHNSSFINRFRTLLQNAGGVPTLSISPLTNLPKKNAKSNLFNRASGEYFSPSKCLSAMAESTSSARPQVEENSMNFHPAFLKGAAWLYRGALMATVALFLSGLVLAQQDQPPQNQDQAPPPSQQQSHQPPQQSDRPPQSQQAQPQNQQATPPPPSEDSNRPPITSVDRMPQTSQQNAPPNGRQSAPDEYGGQYGQQNPSQFPQQNTPNTQSAPPPALLTIPAGTVVIMRLNDSLSSDHNQIGDQFSGTLDQPIVVNGWVVARRGQVVMGQVKSVQKAGRIKGTSQLGVELTDITLVNGEQAPVLTQPWRASGGTSHGADAGTIAGGTALGAIIGSAADWGRGAAIGAGAGAVAGIGAVLLTRGRPTVLYPESMLSFHLVDPVKVDTTHSQQAFYPVSQEDFASARNGRPSLRYGRGYYAPYGPYAPCGYYYPCYYGPGYVGLYPSFGFGWGWGGYYGRGWYGGRGYWRR